MRWSRRSPVIAALLSLVTPGLGQLYNRQTKKCIFFYLACLVLPAALSPLGLQYDFNGIVILFFILILLYLLIIADAFISAIRLKTIEIRPYSKINVYFLILFFVIFYLYASVFVMEQIVCIKTFKIPSHSMSPSIIKGDHIIADLKYYKNNKPEHGDLVIFKFPDNKKRYLLKRVIAVEGENIEFRDKRVTLNGSMITEPYVFHSETEILANNESPRDNSGPHTIPPKTFFAAGDNRDQSHDSRFFGSVEERDIVGKVLYIYWSGDRNRIGRKVY